MRDMKHEASSGNGASYERSQIPKGSTRADQQPCWLSDLDPSGYHVCIYHCCRQLHQRLLGMTGQIFTG